MADEYSVDIPISEAMFKKISETNVECPNPACGKVILAIVATVSLLKCPHCGKWITVNFLIEKE